MPLDISITTGSTVPIYRQIVDQIGRAVATGRLVAGEQVPSVRALAEELVLNPNTVARSYGDLVRDGVCGVLIARKLRVSQPTASDHLNILVRAGLLGSKRVKQWIFYKRDEARIKKIKKTILARV